MEQYIVTGMSCAACQARVEKAVNGVAGVTSCSVSLLTNSMGVEGNASSKDIIDAVVKAGYGASLKGAAKQSSQDESLLEDHETPKLKKRLIVSLCFLCILMYFSMGHMMWNWPIPSWFNGNHVALGLVQMLLAIIIMVINQKFYINGYKALWNRAPNMDTLVALGSSASFIWSTYALFMMSDAVVKGNEALVMEYMNEFYFESAAMIVTLITLGKMLEARSKGKTTDALKGLMKLAPKTAVIERNGIETTVSIEEVQKEDIVIIRPGENVPVDGIIIEGSSAFNESALTGESIPVDKTVGDHISAATINQSGFIKAKALRVGEDTTLSQIIQMVSDAAATKAPIAKIADKVSGIFVPAVMSIALITIIIWLFVGQSLGFALARGISVLVISCPCALGLATPVAIMVGNGVGAKNGILFKNATSLEQAGKTQIVVLDKTGTITLGQPKITDLIPQTITEEELLSYAYALEAKSEHPLAKAIVDKAKEMNLTLMEVTNFTAMPGNGLKASLNGKELIGGNANFITQYTTLTQNIIDQAQMLSDQGKTPLYFVYDHVYLGIIAVADIIKEDSPKAIQELKNMGIHVVMLTGDNLKTAKAIGKQVGVDEVVAGVLPDGKESVVKQLKEKGKVAMVGDGINDAPALTRADLGIAIGAGTDVAIDAADVVLMKSELSDVPAAIRLSKATLMNIYENLFWAFFYNCIGIPLAAGVFISLFGWKLNPMFGAAAMSMSSFCVCSNALRLNLTKLYDDSKDKKGKNALSGNLLPEQNEEITIEIKVGEMMCPHCEATVKKAVEAIEGVNTASASYEKENVIIKLSKAVDLELIKKAIIEAGYPILEEKEYTIKVGDMMCHHCENAVMNALNNIDGIHDTKANFETGSVIFKSERTPDFELIKKAIEEEGYEYLG